MYAELCLSVTVFISTGNDGMTRTSRTGYENVSVDLLAALFLTFAGFAGSDTGRFRSVQLACPEAVEERYNQFSKLSKA